MKLTLDFAQEQRTELVFPNIFNGQDNPTISFCYDIQAPREGDAVHLSLWGFNDLGKKELWRQYMFAQVPDNSSFLINFDGFNQYNSFSLVAQKGEGLVFPRANLVIESVPEPSMMALVIFFLFIAFIGWIISQDRITPQEKEARRFMKNAKIRRNNKVFND